MAPDSSIEAGPGMVAVVVLYRPQAAVLDNVRAIAGEFGGVIAVNNGSDADLPGAIFTEPGVSVVSLNGNLGIATALNRGLAKAESRGARWVVTFDQDSRPEPGFASAIQETARRIPRVAMVGPSIREADVAMRTRWPRPHPVCPLFFTRTPCERGDLPDVTMVITSGALTSLQAWRELGGFDEKLFIDFVDTDFCLRLRSAGWRVAVSGRARLIHHLGRREARTFMGKVFYPTHHEPIRHYYIARNRVRMIGRHGWRHPHWLMFECAAVLMWTFRVLAFERCRRKKLTAMALGTWAGLRGRFGPCPRDLTERLQS